MSDQGSGRYLRSSAGMVGAMIVTIGVILVFVAFRTINRGDVEVEREAVDYLPAVRVLQENGATIAYPPSLPEGWKAVDIEPAIGNGWSLDILTDDAEFVGVYQGERPTGEFLRTYVDKSAKEGPAVTLPSDLSPSWQSWSEDGGKYAVTTKVDGTALLVFGTATHDEIEQIAASLVTTPVP